MGRPSKSSLELAIPIPKKESERIDNESRFLAELLNGLMTWRGEIERLKEAGKEFEREQEYAEAYQLLLHKFTVPKA